MSPVAACPAVSGVCAPVANAPLAPTAHSPSPSSSDLRGPMAAFERALSAAAGAPPTRAGSPAGHGLAEVLKPFARIQAESASLSAQMSKATEAGRSMTPGETAMLTVRCHAFMFQCQLTASVAHRSADGVQQLLRQQA